ncbi:SdpI family protein [Algivirga pacifica]|uniref:SdpI family protein n=1 Tax=Algivirga pacifica TaxID=1162670 RepID=A0ABP9DG77_9BACT
MKHFIKKELPLIIIALIPLVYLLVIWEKLPEKVPLHWNISGEIDRWGSKMTLAGLVLLLNPFMYLLLWVVPKIDPKRKVNNMGGKYYQLRVLMGLFFSALAIFILIASQKQEMNDGGLLALIGLLFVGMGNYMKTIRHNYFIGIRTPWTLESEEVWKKTHALGGRIWFIGGLLIFVSCLLIQDKQTRFTIFLGLTLIISFIPMIYSYFLYKKG